MFVFEFVIALLLVGAVLSLWSARLGVPYPALLALAGAAWVTLSITTSSARALSGVACAGRCGAGPDAWSARTHAGPGACPGFVRRTGIARRGLRRLAARPARQSNPGDQPGDRRCRRNDRCGCDDRASVRAGNELGCRDHARRHRRAARCFRSRGGIAPIEAAPPDPGRAGRRKPVQRRQRTARLSHRGRRGGDRQFFRLARSCPCSC